MSNEKPIIDDFNGNDVHLIESAKALIALSDRGAMVPHGIGGHARGILSAFIIRTESALAREASREWVGGDPVAWRTIYPDGSKASWCDGKGHWPVRNGFAGGLHGFEYAFSAPVAPQREAQGDLGHLVRVCDLPAPITNPEAWPPGYAEGFNACCGLIDQAPINPPHHDRGDVEQRARELLAHQYADDPAMAIKVREGTSSSGEVHRAIRAITATLSAAKPQAVSPVGEAGTMPGTDGFTMACFRAADVPVGTKLYASPQAEAKTQAGEVLSE